MLDTLKLSNFKAHTELDLVFDEKNILMFGENGSGKTSIYEALQISFFSPRLEPLKSSYATEEIYEESKKEFYRGYNRKPVFNDFVIKINGTDWKQLSREEYNVIMISNESFAFDANEVIIDQLTQSLFIDFHDDFNKLQDKLIELANSRLKKYKEDVEIDIDKSDGAILVTDNGRGLLNVRHLKKYFNEAKLNLILLSIVFSIGELTTSSAKKNIVIMDDIVSSFDMANRTFVFRDIVETFSNHQKIIFTHSINFYNLLTYMIEDNIINTKEKWRFVNLYEIENNHSHYYSDSRYKLEDLRKEYEDEKKLPTPDFTKIGNKIRQKFERILYELSKTLLIGGVEESDVILNRIANGKNVYLFKNGESYKDSSELIEEIKSMDSVDKIKNRISQYELGDLKNVGETLRNLKLYRKVTMHPLSHGKVGQHQFHVKEIEQSFVLLGGLEKYSKSLLTKDVNE